MSMGKRTRANPKGMSRTISMASATKIGRGFLRNNGNGYVMDAPVAAGNQKMWGSDVKDWSGIHVTFTTDQAAYLKVTAAYVVARVWRYYNTHPMAVADARLEGAWIQGEDRVIPMTGPAMTPLFSQHHVFDTRNSDKMFIQVASTHVSGADPPAFSTLVEWVQIQMWGYTRKDEPIGVEISTGGGGAIGDTSINLAGIAALLATGNASLVIIAGGEGDNYITGTDAAFVVGSSPAVVDVNVGLGRNGNQGWITNDGPGDFTLSYSHVGVPTYGGEITLKNGETFSFDGKNIDQFRITWVADSAYRYFIR